MSYKSITILLLSLLTLTPFFRLKAEVLSDVNHLKIIGKKLSYINFVFNREIKIAINNDKDLKYISKITLPEIFDKTYVYHTSSVKNIGQYYSSVSINHFICHKINNGVRKEINYIKSDIQLKSLLLEREAFGNFMQVQFTAEEIQIGDTVILKYSYTVPYEENLSLLTNYRIFFNDVISKKYFEFKITHKNDLLISVSTQNSTAPSIKRDKKLSKTSYTWKEENLDGCISENKAILYKSLPNIILSCTPNTFYYLLPNSTKLVPRPLYSVAAYNREAQFLNIIESIKIGNKSKQYNQLNSFINEHTSKIKKDSVGIEKLTAIHNTIVKDFKYDNDFDYYDEVDTRNERLGDFVSKKVIRDRSRFSLYVAIIKSLNLSYFTGYIVDRRSGIISNEYLSPMFKDEYLIVPIFKDESIRYILPKKDGLGYFLDELPFYYENTQIRLVHITDYLNKEKPISDKLRAIQTPRSSVKDNTRNSTATVDVNTTTREAIFNSKIKLKGQFSTLTRFIYDSNNKDKTINPLYNITQWKKIGAKNVVIKQVKSKTTFPFNADFDASFIKKNALMKVNNNFEFPLMGYFNHVIDTNIKVERVLPYYPDFVCYDLFNYFMKFDKPLKLINPYSKTIENKLGKYTVEIIQVSPNIIKVSSLFVITQDIVLSEDIQSVIEISDEINNLNDYSLKLEE